MPHALGDDDEEERGEEPSLAHYTKMLATPGSALSRPDTSGIRGGSNLKATPAAGDTFPYDIPDRSRALGKSFSPPGRRSSSGADQTLPLVPRDTEHTRWDDDVEDGSSWEELGEALGVPFSMALSSRGRHRSGMATVPAHYTDGSGDVSDDELVAAGRADPWKSLADFLVRSGEPLDIDVDKEEPVDIEASRTWRGLVPPDDQGDT